MYFRTTQRRNRDGSVVQYYQLAHNYRDPSSGKCRAKIIHNFGRADQLDRADLVRLCNSIARVCALEVSDPKMPSPSSRHPGDPLPPDVELGKTRELGSILLIEGLWRKLGLDSLFKRIATEAGCSAPYERALFAMVANRLCEPHSKLGVWERWLPHVHLPSCWELKLDQFYEAMDLLFEHAAEVEERVFFQTANLFNLEVDSIFYDTTTAEFCIDGPDEDEEGQVGLRKWGRNKVGGSSIQVSVALAVTPEGFPVRSWVFPGNTTDISTIERVKADLRAWKLGRCLLVGDCGMNSEDNRRELARAGGRYLLAVRADTAEVDQEVLSRRGRYTEVSENLRVKEVLVGRGERRRRYFLCFNPQEAERQKKHRKEVLAGLREEFARHGERHVSYKWVAQLRASARTGRYLSVNALEWIEIDQDKVKKAARLDGKWVLMTNDDTLSREDAARGYKAAALIEDCFRSLKSVQIQMRPMYHRLPQRIEAHVKLCVLALLLQRVAEHECGRPWSHLREELRELQATELRTPQHLFFRRNALASEVANILKTLQIKAPKTILDIP